LARFEAKRNGHTANGGGPYLLVTRNLEPMYNIKMALEAFETVKKSYPASRLDIIGTGQQEAELKSWVERQGIADVCFHGAVPNEEIPLFLKQADILLNPSNVDNMPINLLEAFASGVPVVSTRAGGIPDLVGEERAALLVEPGNSSAMASKVVELVEHPEKAKKLTAYARDLCREFGWVSNRQRWLEAYFAGEQGNGSRRQSV
jgi:glycosyltransferase involved in cell wall biosynthesis